MGSYRYRSLIEGLYTFQKPFYTLNSPPVVAFNYGVGLGSKLGYSAWFWAEGGLGFGAEGSLA